MKVIKNKIVYSNDIQRLLNGNNALNYSLDKQGLKIPNSMFFKELRKDFLKDTKKIFSSNVEVIDEDDMLEALDKCTNYYKELPHRLFRQSIFRY